MIKISFGQVVIKFSRYTLLYYLFSKK